MGRPEAQPAGALLVGRREDLYREDAGVGEESEAAEARAQVGLGRERGAVCKVHAVLAEARGVVRGWSSLLRCERR